MSDATSLEARSPSRLASELMAVIRGALVAVNVGRVEHPASNPRNRTEDMTQVDGLVTAHPTYDVEEHHQK